MLNIARETIACIVIPVFNEQQTIEKALDHLLQQKKSDSEALLDKKLFEIIIIWI